MKNKVTVSAPGKLMLFGEHAVIYGMPCIVTAVDQRIYAKVEKTDTNLIVVNAPSLGVKSYSVELSDLGRVDYPKEVRFVLKSVEIFFRKFKVKSGLIISTKSDFSSTFGFGSSSAVTVCTIKALSGIFDIQVDDKSLFDIAYKTVLQVQGVGSGFDLAAAIWGGTIYFVGGGKIIISLKIEKLPLVVGYTGIKADTASLVRKVGYFYKSNKKEIKLIFDAMKLIVESAKKDLVVGNYTRVGDLANINQGLLDSLGVNTKKLSDLILAARVAGATGAKLSGAGGGDCMIAFSPKSKKAIEKAIEAAGGKILSVKTSAPGVRIEQ